ncbi:MAG: sortase family protein [Candidatus Amesbacteria bacterium GW2011_GWA2_42_12]|uniref:Sortase family protein n=1 Tax=Candidatus Amesbacteria bacterium GW2011_GWA2_42_12 TaxID=1618356 RepID=A0A0G1B4H4_9BACT|nr:MAG: sortase family protein [Candidatus Amesbacteria bacterium GW2011_GWA2_42_12]
MKSGTLHQGKELNVGKLILKLKTMAWGLKWMGALLIIIAVFGLIIIYGPLFKAETNYQISTNFKSKFADSLKPIPLWKVPDNNYSVYIPKIQATSRVIGNVDASNEKAYLQALKIGVAEALGLAHPGQKGTTYLFAHSTDGPWNFTRYNAVFYLLDKTEKGDIVEIVYKNKLYKYSVFSKSVLGAQDTRYLVPQDKEEQLVLQTCWPPGTAWKRLVVVAKPMY